MVKAAYILYKRPDMDHQEFRRYWKDVHGPIGARIPGLRCMIQSHALPQGGDARPAYR